MSHVVLRRVAIRLLHDPAFVESLRADPERTLAGLDISGEERRFLVEVPPAAWRTDPDRQGRLLAALADEFTASLALAPDRAASFFASDHFHRAVQQRGSLALAFGAHLAGDPRVAELARLETTIAAVRRAPAVVEPTPGGSLRTSPRARVAIVLTGTATLMEAVHSGTPQPPLGSVREHLLVVGNPTTRDVTIEELPPALAAVLVRAETPTPRGDLRAVLSPHDATPEEAEAAIGALERDAILV